MASSISLNPSTALPSAPPPGASTPPPASACANVRSSDLRGYQSQASARADSMCTPPSPPQDESRSRAAQEAQKREQDANEARKILQSIMAAAQKARAERWKILHDAATQGFDVRLNSMARRSEAASKAMNAWSAAMRGG